MVFQLRLQDCSVFCGYWHLRHNLRRLVDLDLLLHLAEAVGRARVSAVLLGLVVVRQRWVRVPVTRMLVNTLVFFVFDQLAEME